MEPAKSYIGRIGDEWLKWQSGAPFKVKAYHFRCDLIIRLDNEVVVKNRYGTAPIPRSDIISDKEWVSILLSAVEYE